MVRYNLLENAKNIRFITSNYEDHFKIPDGSAVEIEYPNRKFSARCEYMDEYHLRLGYDVLHICQLASLVFCVNGGKVKRLKMKSN